MDKVYIISCTQSGNTGAMASAIGEGVKEAGKSIIMKIVLQCFMG